jgi:UPF0148 protein
MSDTDDGFDEEAVRRELREKYEDDDREETERMSELLLKGATMTNQHCDACGTPIFRYDGQAFCPNCQHEYEQAQGQADQQGQPQQPAASGDESASADDAPPAAESAAETAGNAQPGTEHAAPDAGRRQPPSQADRTGGDASDRNPRARDQAPRTSQVEQGGASNATPVVTGEGADALDASIAALARRAAGSDDPRRAREYLGAAREAAEALAALRRNE